MARPQSEYALEDCAKGLKEPGRNGYLQVSYDSSGKCSKAKDCKTLCEHRKK